ncbi:MAG TPA: autotransporter outer membrane beta-barrel domain-containing protein [Xanthobacteraceae bacterium]|nr:autotransporter outer membrane beta-barrel domain-containing protein [Xanthobacteraceae bacterium]
MSLTLILALQTLLTPNLPVGAPTNVINAAGAVDSFTNNGGTLPTNFQNLFNLSPSQLQAALTQLDGEASTDAEKGAFELMNQFMGLMLDPFVAGRGSSINGNGLGFAPEQQASLPPEIAQAYASVFKAPPMAAPPTQQWTAWGSGFGASSKTDGNASVGSNNVTAANYGFAGGMDYHYTPDSLVGFALAGAGTNWNLAQGLGGGRSDAFQAGVYTKSYYGPAYVAGALAFANNWFTTDRSALGDELHASFIGQSYGGRFESGYRFGLPASGSVIGATPYAAIQTQWFHTPTYGETDLAGGGLGLTYNSMTANDTRSELGARFDDLTALNGMPLILRTRLAWAHDWVTNPALNAVFESLPGSSFIVNGAKQPADSALVSTGAELHMTARWSLAAKFDGEFASGSQTYGGTGTLRYTW